MATPSVDELLTQVARLSASESYWRRSSNDHYNRLRKYEAAIKKHARGECSCKGKGECLSRLVAITPVNPRPTLNQLRKRTKR